MRMRLDELCKGITSKVTLLGSSISSRMSGRLGNQLRQWKLLPTPPAELAPLESAVDQAMDTVSPTQSFRERLRENLSIAAESAQQGVVVDYPRPVRQMLVVGISAGVVLATTLGFVLALVSKSARKRQQNV